MTDVLVTGNLTVEGIVTGGGGGSTSIKCAVLSDQKPSGTSGGATVVGFQDRTLNTLDDPNNLITLDAGNVLFQFNETGTYYIEAYAEAVMADEHKMILTDSSNMALLIGTSTFSDRIVPQRTRDAAMSSIQDLLTVTSTSQQYKIRHYVKYNDANGFGVPLSVSGINELYAYVAIIKIYD